MDVPEFYDAKKYRPLGAADRMLNTALDARNSFVNAKTVQQGLTAIETKVTAAYERDEAIFVKHRGSVHKNSDESDLLNYGLDFLRAIRGVCMIVPTVVYMAVTQRVEGPGKFLSSFFHRAETGTVRAFRAFKEETTAAKLKGNEIKPPDDGGPGHTS